jgi:transposase
MTNIIEQITDQIRQARLAHNTVKMDDLVILKSEIMYGLSQKQSVSPQKTIQRLVTSYQETQALVVLPAAVKRYQEKIDLYKSFLVYNQQLDTNALEELLNTHKPSSIREWMSFLKENYPDQYDGRLASTLYNNR